MENQTSSFIAKRLLFSWTAVFGTVTIAGTLGRSKTKNFGSAKYQGIWSAMKLLQSI
jgi:hypothetical protein